MSCTNPDAPWIIRNLVSALEVLLDRNRIEKVYYRLKQQNFDIATIFENALTEAQISVEYSREKLNAIPKSGPLMFVANHPFGVVDGVVLCDMASFKMHRGQQLQQKWFVKPRLHLCQFISMVAIAASFMSHLTLPNRCE